MANSTSSPSGSGPFTDSSHGSAPHSFDDSASTPSLSLVARVFGRRLRAEVFTVFIVIDLARVRVRVRVRIARVDVTRAASETDSIPRALRPFVRSSLRSFVERVGTCGFHSSRHSSRDGHIVTSHRDGSVRFPRSFVRSVGRSSSERRERRRARARIGPGGVPRTASRRI